MSKHWPPDGVAHRRFAKHAIPGAFAHGTHIRPCRPRLSHHPCRLDRWQLLPWAAGLLAIAAGTGLSGAAAVRDAPAVAAESMPGVDAPAIRASFGYCYTDGGTNCVVDGDTFWIAGHKVRIAGIDAPETHPSRCAEEARLGKAASHELNALLNSGTVRLTPIDRDRDVYGRLLRNVAVDGRDVGETMIGAGVARAYGSGRRRWCG